MTKRKQLFNYTLMNIRVEYFSIYVTLVVSIVMYTVTKPRKTDFIHMKMHNKSAEIVQPVTQL